MRRQLRLELGNGRRENVRRSSHQTTAALQTCGARSASARFSRARKLGRSPSSRTRRAGRPGEVAKNHYFESRAGIEPAQSPVCSRWPFQLGYLDGRGAPGPGSPPCTPEPLARDVRGDRPVSIRNLRVHSATCRATTPRSPQLFVVQTHLCPRLESNQRLLGFSQAPSPDRLQRQVCGRSGARPRAWLAIRLSQSE